MSTNSPQTLAASDMMKAFLNAWAVIEGVNDFEVDISSNGTVVSLIMPLRVHGDRLSISVEVFFSPEGVFRRCELNLPECSLRLDKDIGAFLRLAIVGRLIVQKITETR